MESSSTIGRAELELESDPRQLLRFGRVDAQASARSSENQLTRLGIAPSSEGEDQVKEPQGTETCL